jgi:hypothetical protein
MTEHAGGVGGASKIFGISNFGQELDWTEILFSVFLSVSQQNCRNITLYSVTATPSTAFLIHSTIWRYIAGVASQTNLGNRNLTDNWGKRSALTK